MYYYKRHTELFPEVPQKVESDNPKKDYYQGMKG